MCGAQEFRRNPVLRGFQEIDVLGYGAEPNRRGNRFDRGFVKGGRRSDRAHAAKLVDDGAFEDAGIWASCNARSRRKLRCTSGATSPAAKAPEAVARSWPANSLRLTMATNARDL